MELSGKQFSQLEQSLEEAYPTEVKLGRLIRTTFDTSLQRIAEGDNHQDRIDKVIEWAESKSYEAQLIRGAHRRNPSNARMRQFCLSVADALLEDAIAQKLTDISLLAIQTLIGYLRDRNMPFEKVIDAGIAALPAGAGDDPDDDDYADFKCAGLLPEMRLYGLLRLILAKHPGLPNAEPTLLCFARTLAEALDDSLIGASLSTWVQQQTEALPGDQGVATQRRSRRAKLSGTLLVSLMVTVELSTKSKPGKPRYLVNGYLYFDHPVDCDKPSFELPPLQSLSLPEEAAQVGVECAWAEVKSYTSQYFDEAIAQLKRLKQSLCCRRYELSVEMFLPRQKLGEPVDQWSYSNSGRQEPLGKDYGVIVRISDRLQNDEIRLNALYETWDRLQERLVCLENLNEHVEPVHDFADYKSWRHLENALRKSLGLKICCGLPSRPKDQSSVFESVFYSDTPLAVWTRDCDLIDPCSDTPLDIAVELVPFLKAEGIQDMTKLAAQLKEVRQRAWENSDNNSADNNEEGQCLGDHLAFLLDNPDRLPHLPEFS